MFSLTKRILAAVLVFAVLALCFAACKDDKKDSNSKDASAQVSIAEDSSALDSSESSDVVSSEEREDSEDSLSSAESSKVEESSKPTESSKVEESSKAEESAKTEESLKPTESSKIEESSKVEESSKPTESSKVEESSKAEESSKVEESSKAEESSKVEESSTPVEPPKPTDPLNPLPEALYKDAVDSYFDNSVFLGYSIMMHFGRYVSQWRTEVDPSIMGNAKFCAGVGISFHADATQTPSTPQTTLPTYRGQAYNFADLPSATGSDTLYIGLMGYSDMKWAGSPSSAVSEGYRSTVAGIQRIQAKNPGLKIVILANTYNTGIFQGLSKAWQDNSKVLEYNNKVLDYCNQNGIDFIDVATPLTDHRGYFVADYATDGEYHITKEAYYLWMAALRDYATKKQNGTWQNLKTMPALPYLS